MTLHETYAQRLFDDIHALSKSSTGVTREAFLSVEDAVLDYLDKEALSLGMTIEVDNIGNHLYRLEGTRPELAPVVMGSHVDSVPEGGHYDGLAGVISAMTIAHALTMSEAFHERAFCILAMRGEESSFYGKAYLGSLGLMGDLEPGHLKLTHRTTGESLGEVLSRRGVDTQKLQVHRPAFDALTWHAFLELHIEQGPVLDKLAPERLGIVTGIRGNYRAKAITIYGETAHSGAVDRQYRHDAVMAFGDFLHRMESYWGEVLEVGEDLVMTVGVVHTASTSAISVIPGECTFTMDIRSLDKASLDKAWRHMREVASVLMMERGVKLSIPEPIVTEPVKMAPAVYERLHEAAKRHNMAVRLMPSGAGHDSAVMAGHGIPTAMVFVANQNGSHNPHEAMLMKDFMAGTQLVFYSLLDDFLKA